MILEKFMKRCLTEFMPENEAQWNYTAGCVLLGAMDMEEATGDADFARIVKRFATDYVDKDGIIKGYNPDEHNVDLMCSAKAFFPLLDRTGDPRFRAGLEYVYTNLLEQPRTKEGNFWHKQRYPNQVWLDGLYMVQPFYVEYETRYCGNEHLSDTMRQFENVRRYLFLEDRQLYVHGYDESREMYWADKQTGRSSAIWLRSVGWYVMALTDCFEKIPEKYSAERKRLAELLLETLDGMLPHLDREKYMFFQVVDQPELEGNYHEASGSCMLAYAMMKGVRIGMLPACWADIGAKILEGVVAECLVMQEGKLVMTHICASAGLGTFDGRIRTGKPEYYVSERQITDNAHGVATIMMAYSEYIRMNQPNSAADPRGR